MHPHHLSDALAGLPLSAWRYLPQIDSTNAEALRWVETGAPHLALVLADEQTAGRGRQGRRWFTPPGAALAFSLIMRQPQPPGPLPLGRLSGLGALAVCTALQTLLPPSASPQIKWPNDVLLQRRKVAGVLPEATWQGSTLTAVVLGVGVNITPASLPPPAGTLYPAGLLFPATYVEAHLPPPVDRPHLLRLILQQLLAWLPLLPSDEFLHAWQSRLAFLGEQVRLTGLPSTPGLAASLDGTLLGLAPDGSLRLRLPTGREITLQFGEVHLRPLENGLQ